MLDLKFNKKCIKILTAAEILGVSRNVLSRQFKDRQISEKNFNNLRNAQFDPYYHQQI